MKAFKYDISLFLLLIAASFISVYFFPVVITRIIFLVILAFAFYTKYDYIYLTWFFIINDAPGRLFMGAGTTDAIQRIPIYSFGPGFSFAFQDLFIIVMVIKFFLSKRELHFIFKNQFIYLYLFASIVFIYSLAFGMSFVNITRTVRLLLPWSLIMIVPFYVNSRAILNRVCLFIFPIVFLALASQLYTFITGRYWVNTLMGIEQTSLMLEGAMVAVRSYSAGYISFFALIIALFHFFSRQEKYNNNYLMAIIFTGILSIVLTATRGWILAILILMAGVLLIFANSVRIKSLFYMILAMGILTFITLNYFPLLEKQIQFSFQRVLTLESLAEGDITAGGTLGRLDQRAPRVMSKFWESPVIGWGFSDEYHRFADGHIGHHNILLNVGIFGYLAFLLFYFNLIGKIYTISNLNSVRKIYGNATFILILGLIAVFVIHSTSTQFWGFIMHFSQTAKILFFAFLFASVNIIFYSAEAEQQRQSITKHNPKKF
jgi:hypothetical protein